MSRRAPRGFEADDLIVAETASNVASLPKLELGKCIMFILYRFGLVHGDATGFCPDMH